MKPLLVVLLAAATTLAFAQEGRGRHGHGPRWHPAMQAPGGPGYGMSREERQRLRDELKAARREVRAGPPGQRFGPPMPPEERERLRRDLHDVNQDLGRGR